MENQFDKINLEDLLYNSKIPVDWDSLTVTFKKLLRMSQLDLPNSNLVKAVAALTNNHDYVTSIRKNLLVSLEKYKKKKKNQRQ